MNRFRAILLALAAVALLATPVQATTFTLTWSSLSSSIHPNSYATATVQTTVHARCGIVVKYSTTISKAAGLVTKTAPVGGKVSWRWKVGASTKPGTWRVTVTCALGAKKLSIWRTMTIRR